LSGGVSLGTFVSWKQFSIFIVAYEHEMGKVFGWERFEVVLDEF
jgi:hypothetical protein